MRNEEDRRACFLQNGPFWHLCTPAGLAGKLFSFREDFLFGMNLVAICAAAFPQVRVLTFALTGSQLSFLLAGEQDGVLLFFRHYKKRLRRYLADRVRYPDLARLDPGLRLVPDLQELRREIIRVNRQGCTARSGFTPYSYPWGAGILYFNPLILDLPKVPWSYLSQERRRALSHSRLLQLPASYLVYKGIIAPSSYCVFHEGEAYFKDAQQYFRFLGREESPP